MPPPAGFFGQGYDVENDSSLRSGAMTPDALEREVLARLGVMPNFFGSVSGSPGLAEAMWAFAKSAYLDCPLPSVFKERLFVHLARFCEIRYCIVRHVGFLIGAGRPAGDPHAKPETVGEVCTLLQRPLPDANALTVVFTRLESCEKAMDIPPPGTQAEYDLFDALSVLVIDPARSKRAREAVRKAVGADAFESLTAFIAFVRMAQFWTDTHPDLAIEGDMIAVFDQHDELARLLLDPSEAERMKAGEALRQTLAELENVKASLRTSSETLEIALQSAGQFAWEADLDTRDIKLTGDRSAFGFDVPVGIERFLTCVPPEDIPSVRDGWQALLAGKPPHDFQHRLINPLSGETVWVHATGRLISGDGRSKVVGIARNITTQKRREEELGVLVGELQHRTRNLISVIAAIADKTLATSQTFDDFKTAFNDRLGTLARVQGLFFRMREGDRITFDELLKTELSAQSVRVGEDGVVVLDGPAGIRLRSGTVQTLALVLHELVTNAVKYGALGQPGGRLVISWRFEAGKPEVSGEPRLHLEWKERGVKMPPAGAEPRGTGQGRELIEQALRHQFAVQTTFAMEADGVRFAVSLPVSRLGPRR
jgi:two-component sensor histidine kinase/PAS domain-containing protein